MAKFDRPSEAFQTTSHFVKRNNAKITLHSLDNSLKGFEMVVASSNNKAVENVSAELPSMEAIAEDADNLRYFASISNNVLESSTWGMIAAVLGNSTNRYQFSQNFWRDEEFGLSTYLNHAAGVPQYVTEKTEGIPVQRLRKIVTAESPPQNRNEALRRWKQERTSFIEAIDDASKMRDFLQDIHIELAHINELEKLILDAGKLIKITTKEIDGDLAYLAKISEDQSNFQEQLHFTTNSHNSHINCRPNIWARVILTKEARKWSLRNRQLVALLAELNQKSKAANHHQKGLEQQITNRQELLNKTQSDLEKYKEKHHSLLLELPEKCSALKALVPDSSFFERPHDEVQKASLWLDNVQQRQRDRVFEKAIALHRAFIDCSADQLRQNISVFIETFGTKSLGSIEKDDLIPDLWSSFFLVVPVISTTFASVNRMFTRIPPETLGWLLIDEAGQAAPQQAVGALMRTKQAVIVGDPLQVEPVVALPSQLTEEICVFFRIEPEKYNAPEASVQSVADRSSIYCSRFPIGSGYRDVGSPLLVHRRCNSPMFDISNEIAYSGLMVQAKEQKELVLPLGPSRWINVIGKPGPDKWCKDEADELIKMLQILKNSQEKPDIYIVTPFVVVQDNLRRHLLESQLLKGWVTDPSTWVYDRIGTVHTVQGREAETVFFVLGAQAPSQRGARAWAGSKPNLVNVAVTRAKSACYVIGNHELWKSAGVFSTVSRHLFHDT